MDYPFADLSLARRLELAEGHANKRLIEARAHISPETGACWMETGGALAMYDGPDSPLTQTFGLGVLEPATGPQLDAIEAFFRGRGVPVHHETSPVADPSVRELLVARHYHPIEYSSVLYRPIGSGLRLPAPNPAVLVRRVAPADRDRWAATAAEGWSEYPGIGQFMLDIGRVQGAAEDSYQFLAELHGQAIATGALVAHGGVALLAGASTVPSARKHGAQLALLEARLRFAVDLGCDLALMAALPGSGSQRNAERHGFRVAYTRIKWML